MKGVDWGGTEDPGDLVDAIVLGHLEEADKALLTNPGVSNWSTVCQDGDDECIVDLVPVEEVEASDGVAEDADAPDGRVGVVGHYRDVGPPVEVAVDEDPEEAEGLGGGDVLWAEERVSISEACDGAPGVGTI